jgi:hypothetical protein
MVMLGRVFLSSAIIVYELSYLLTVQSTSVNASLFRNIILSTFLLDKRFHDLLRSNPAVLLEGRVHFEQQNKFIRCPGFIVSKSVQSYEVCLALLFFYDI